MPEVLTKFPEIVLQILKQAGIECGTGATQKILAQCPPERFCSLPSGEICVYGIEDISKMTQISATELVQSVGNVSVIPDLNILGLTFGIGLFMGGLVVYFITKSRKSGRNEKKKG